MSRLSITIVTLVCSTLVTVGVALAEPEAMKLRCQPVSPASGELDCVAAVDNHRDLADRTHSSIFPTGNLLRDGEVSYQVHEFGLLSRAAIGLTDNVELNLSAPLFPVFAGVGFRVGLLPRESSYRAVIGAGLWLPLIDDEDVKLIQSNLTVAYQNDRLNLHATIGGIKPLDEDDALFTYSAGFAYKVGTKAALIGEALRLTLGQVSDGCGDYEGGDCSGGDNLHLDGVLIGVKLMGKHFDTDLGLFVPLGEDDSDIIGVPVVSMSYRY